MFHTHHPTKEAGLDVRVVSIESTTDIQTTEICGHNLYSCLVLKLIIWSKNFSFIPGAGGICNAKGEIDDLQSRTREDEKYCSESHRFSLSIRRP